MRVSFALLSSSDVNDGQNSSIKKFLRSRLEAFARESKTATRGKCTVKFAYENWVSKL